MLVFLANVPGDFTRGNLQVSCTSRYLLILCYFSLFCLSFQSTVKTTEYAASNNPTAITLEEYLDPNFDLKGRDIGRPKEVTIRTQK